VDKPSKLAAKVLAKEIKRQVIAKQRGWYGRRATAMNDKLARRQADPNTLSILSLTPSLPLSSGDFKNGLDVAD
jgi:hypothetical protein